MQFDYLLLTNLVIAFAPPAPITESCVDGNATNSGTILASMTINKTSPLYCQLECQLKLGCVHFNYNKASLQCVLLSSQGNTTLTGNLTTGPKICNTKSKQNVSDKLTD
jgi:hypothetical protein